MYKPLFLLLLTGHMLGDFYTQPERLASSKNSRYTMVALHSLVYGLAVFAVIAVTVPGSWTFFSAGIAVVGHFAVDTGKYALVRRKPKLSQRGSLYLADQALHLLLALLAAMLFALCGQTLVSLPWISTCFAVLPVDAAHGLSWLLLLLTIWKPANITIKKLLVSYRPQNMEEQVLAGIPSNNAGGYIGLLERILIALFLAIGQYSAIGLVLTAKSIARYNRIAEDKSFAEYYLLGTLLSTLVVVAAYLVIFT